MIGTGRHPLGPRSRSVAVRGPARESSNSNLRAHTAALDHQVPASLSAGGSPPLLHPVSGRSPVALLRQFAIGNQERQSATKIDLRAGLPHEIALAEARLQRSGRRESERLLLLHLGGRCALAAPAIHTGRARLSGC